MNRLATAAVALLLGLCAIFPTKAHAEEWRWCVAGDLLDSGRTNGPNLISRPFPADGAPDFQAQYEAYARSIIGPIEGEFIINCSPPFADHDAAVRHNGEWLLSMHDMTGGLFEAEDVFWDPVRTSSSAAAAPDSRSHAEHAAVAAKPAQPAPATAATGNADAQRQAEPTRPSTPSQQDDAARTEQTRQEWERKRVAAQSGGSSSDGSAGAAAKPLRFVLIIGLLPRAGDTHNPNCYSNIITRPGPTGWGAPGFGVSGSGVQANQIIDSLKGAFIAKCRASGREPLSEGNFKSAWNQSEDDEARLQNVRAIFPEDVTVQMD
jgi:hypothetical protein